MTWWDLGDGGTVLEIDFPELERHWWPGDGETVAWWCDAWGRLLGLAAVGVA